MRVLLDTNIVLDYLGANQGVTEDTDKVFDLAAKRKDIKLVSSSPTSRAGRCSPGSIVNAFR